MLTIYEQADNTTITMPHNHTEAELILIAKGSTTVTVDSNVCTVDEGDIVFVNPMQIHSLESDKGEEYHHYCVCLDCLIIIEKATADLIRNEKIRFSNIIRKQMQIVRQ